MASKNSNLASFASNIDDAGNLTISGGGVTVYNTIGDLPLPNNNAGDLAFIIAILHYILILEKDGLELE